MPSPFPGMDPYVEAQREWPDFHNSLACEIRAQLNAGLQTDYYATTVVHIEYDVIEIAQLEVEMRLANVEVRKTGTNTLVTAIEILSPVNKRTGPQREKYLRKRQELFRSAVHVMEIDLLRGGKRSPLEILPPAAPYYVTLGRANNRPRIDVWPIQLADRLPRLPIPLLSPDPDVVLDLGAIVRDVYERGAYARRIDYTQPAPPPELTAEQQAWMMQLLAQQR